jgi:hypothetical protein
MHRMSVQRQVPEKPAKSGSHGTIKAIVAAAGLAASLFAVRSCLHEEPRKAEETEQAGEPAGFASAPRLNLAEARRADFFQEPRVEILPPPVPRLKFMLELDGEIPYESLDCKLVPVEAGFGTRTVTQAFKSSEQRREWRLKFIEGIKAQGNPGILAALLSQLDKLNIEWEERRWVSNISDVYAAQLAEAQEEQTGYVADADCFARARDAVRLLEDTRLALVSLLLQKPEEAKPIFEGLPHLQRRMLNEAAFSVSVISGSDNDLAPESVGVLFSALPAEERNEWADMLDRSRPIYLDNLPAWDAESAARGMESREKNVSFLEQVGNSSCDPSFKENTHAIAGGMRKLPPITVEPYSPPEEDEPPQ